MSNNIININEHLPHITVSSEKYIHIIPESIIRNIINGSKEINILSDDIIKTILKDWLEQIS